MSITTFGRSRTDDYELITPGTEDAEVRLERPDERAVGRLHDDERHARQLPHKDDSCFAPIVLGAEWPVDRDEPVTFVVIPESVASSWWERILYTRSAKGLRAALTGRPHTVVVNVPYRRSEPQSDDPAVRPAA